MIATLVKTNAGYGITNCEIIAFISTRRPEHRWHKLNMQQCDEIFKNKTSDRVLVNILMESNIPVLDNGCLVLHEVKA